MGLCRCPVCGTVADRCSICGHIVCFREKCPGAGHWAWDWSVPQCDGTEKIINKLTCDSCMQQHELWSSDARIAFYAGVSHLLELIKPALKAAADNAYAFDCRVTYDRLKNIIEWGKP